MAQFIGTIDLSPERRARFIQRSQDELLSFYGSAGQAFERGGLAMVSWTQSWEPFRQAETAQGISFVWGHAMDPGEHVSKTPDLGESWRNLPQWMPLPMEGIHVAFLYRPDGSWIAGADLLGLAPLYYFYGKDYAVVGSSPELFRAHPDFHAMLDPAGLAGILLTNGLVSGRTLLQGVQRLGPGNLLYANRGSTPRELTQYRPEPSDRYFGSSFEDNFQRVEEVLEDCFGRHLNAQRSYGLILSGGLDSRVVAAIMKRRGDQFTAFSFGSASDIEMQCAKDVAKALDLDHRTVPIRMNHYVEYAQNECKWKHLANGFNSFMFYEEMSEAPHIRGGMLSGYMENVIGTNHIGWAGRDVNAMCFDSLLKRVTRWGMPAQVVKRLIAKSFDATIVDEVLKELEQTYNGYAEREFQKSWLFGHHHRGRYHTSLVLGLHSRWPWPVLPYVDTKMLDLVGGLPYEHIYDRRLEYHMLKKRFPSLARISLDRNSFNMKPVVPRYGRLIDKLVFKSRQLSYRWTRGIRERRFYYRTMDFNSSAWNEIRAAAEPNRNRALQILDEATLAEILPRPREPFAPVPDPLSDTSKMKLMTGFLLWSARYL